MSKQNLKIYNYQMYNMQNTYLLLSSSRGAYIQSIKREQLLYKYAIPIVTSMVISNVADNFVICQTLEISYWIFVVLQKVNAPFLVVLF